MAYVVKAIKPQRLNVDAIRLEILNALRAEGRIQVREYKKTVSTWHNKVSFDFLIDLSLRDASVLTGPSGGATDVWVRLDEGFTRPPVVPRRAKALRFHAGYRAKTRPRWLGSRQGGATGPVVFARFARGATVAGRLWSETLSKRRLRPFQRSMIAAIQRGAAKMFSTGAK